MKIKVRPHLELNRNDFAFIIALRREATSHKYHRETKVVTYMAGLTIAWVTIGIEVLLIGKRKERK